MLAVMRDSDEPPERRDEMAKAAALLLQQIDGKTRGLPSETVMS